MSPSAWTSISADGDHARLLRIVVIFAEMAPSSTSDPPRNDKRNKRGEGGLLRKDIMAAAAELLEHSSPKDSLTLRGIARLAGVSAPAIYLHFDTVGDILLAVTRDAFEDLGQRLRSARDAAGSDPAERIRAVSRAYLDYAETETARYRLMFGGQWWAVDDVEVGDVSESDLTDLGQDTLDVLTECFTELASAGGRTVEACDPRTASISLWLGLHGLADQRSGSPFFPWPPDIVDVLIERLAVIDPPGASR